MKLNGRVINTLIIIKIVITLYHFDSTNGFPKSEKNLSRQKRLLWITSDGRLALPPGTTLVVNPSLSMPFVRYPPDGFFSNLTMSLPFTIDFDKLGLTDNENPYGVVPPILERSYNEDENLGDSLGSYISSFMKRRKKRSPLELPKSILTVFHGGERAILYVMLEDLLENFGMNGKACLLRAICEVHANPYLRNFGFFGEVLKLFLTATKSPHSELMKEYVKAENDGIGKSSGAAECWPYMKDCNKSLFKSQHTFFKNNSGDKGETENIVIEGNNKKGTNGNVNM